MLWLVSEAARRLRPGHLLVDAPLVVRLAVPLVLFLGLFVDEPPIFAFALVPLVFASLFVRWPRCLGDLTAMTMNGAYFIAPAVAFLACVIFVVPPLTERFFDFRFDYLGNTLAVGANWHGAASFLEGPHASLTPAIMLFSPH